MSDDDKHIPAHKIVLSACSPFLSTILLNHPDPEPVIFFKSVKYEELKAMLDYMYLGNVIVEQVNVQDLLSLAGELQVKGLRQGEGFNRTNVTDIQISLKPQK